VRLQSAALFCKLNSKSYPHAQTRALGFRFLGADGHDLPGLVSALLGLERIIPPHDLKLPRIVAACDVRNPLLGPSGATNVFGAQKGATPEELEILERALTQLADVAAQIFGHDRREIPGAGAAGGLGFGLMTFCGATVRSGFDVVAEAIDLRNKIERADIVITGEGKLDRQTLAGKAPAGLARMAQELKRPVYAIVGQASDDPEVRQLFAGITTLDDSSPDYRDTAQLLETRARELALRLR
jgi:glycerate kinase